MPNRRICARGRACRSANCKAPAIASIGIRAQLTKHRDHVAALASVAIRGLAVVAGFGLTFLIGRIWGPAANGEYALVTQSAMFLSVMAVGGLDLATVREFSLADSGRDVIARRSFITLFAICAAMCAVVLLLTVTAEAISGGLVSRLAGRAGLAILATLLVARAFTRITSATLRSQHRYLIGQSIEVLVIPVGVILAVIVATPPSVDRLLVVTAVISIAAAVAGVLLTLWGRHRPGAGQGAIVARQVDMSAIGRLALPMWFVGVFLNLGDWYGLVVVASQLGIHEAGLYRVATQIGSVFSIISFGLYGVFSARFSVALSRGDAAAFLGSLRSATRLSVALVLPPAILVLLAGKIILGQIGPEFVGAYPVLAVVVVGQIIYTCFGPAGLALALSGHQGISLRITIVSIVSLLVLAPLAAHFGGALGVATCAAVAQVGRNVASAVLVRHFAARGQLTNRREAES